MRSRCCRRFFKLCAFLGCLSSSLLSCGMPRAVRAPATKNEICINSECQSLRHVIEFSPRLIPGADLLKPWSLNANMDSLSRAPKSNSLVFATLNDESETKIGLVIENRASSLAYVALGPVADQCLFRMAAYAVERGMRAEGKDCRGRQITIEQNYLLGDDWSYGDWGLYDSDTDACGWNVTADPVASRSVALSATKLTEGAISEARHREPDMEALWEVASDGTLLFALPASMADTLRGAIREWDASSAGPQAVVVDWCRPDSGGELVQVRNPRDNVVITRSGKHIAMDGPDFAMDLELDPLSEFKYRDWLNGR